MKVRLLSGCVLILFAAFPVRAVEPTAEEMKQIKAKLSALTEALAGAITRF
jgi:hypothetical protein